MNSKLQQKKLAGKGSEQIRVRKRCMWQLQTRFQRREENSVHAHLQQKRN